MAENTVQVVLDLDGKLYDQKISKTEAESIIKGKKIGEKLGGGIAKASASKFDALATGFFVAAFTKVFDSVIGLAGRAGGLISDAISESAQKADAINQLNTALALAGDFSMQASEGLQEFASELQKSTAIGDVETMQMLALAKSFGVTNEQAKQLSLAAANLSAVTGKDLLSSVQQLGGTLTGNLGSLARTAPALKGLSVEALAAGGAIEFINTRFAGAAAAKAQTFSGTIEQMKHQFDDLLETIGNFITRSPVVLEVFSFIAERVAMAGNSLKEFQQSGDVLGEMIIKTVQFGQAVNKFIVMPIEVMVNVVKLAFNTLLVGFQGTIVAVSSLALDMVSVFSPNGQLANSIRAFTENSKTVLGEFVNETSESFSNILNTETTESIAEFLESLEVRTSAAIGRQIDSTKHLANSTKVELDKTGTAFESLKGLIDNVVNGLISSSLANLGAALVGSGQGFGGFAKQAGTILGDFFIQMGMTIIAADAAIMALKASLIAFPGGIGIAAGLGLVIAGGALKALAGGSGAVASVGTAGVAAPPVGGGVGGIDAPPEIAQLTDPERAEPETNVTINVSGVVTDPRGTAKQIGDILKDGFRSNGLNIARATV